MHSIDNMIRESSTQVHTIRNTFIDTSIIKDVSLSRVSISKMPEDPDVMWDDIKLDVEYTVYMENGEIYTIIFHNCDCPFKVDISLYDFFSDNKVLYRLTDLDIQYESFSATKIKTVSPTEEMTVKEIEDELGHPVKIVKEKGE